MGQVFECLTVKRWFGAIGLLVALLAAPLGALAQEGFPALYSVTGVASDDVLNLRAAPGAGNSIVGALGYDETGVEVLGIQNRWAQVNTAEGVGWASTRFLARQVPDGVDLTMIDQLRCFGTEPFWGLDMRPGGQAVLDTPDGAAGVVFEVNRFARAYAPLEKYVLRGRTGEQAMSVVATRAYCDDGMSDRTYGLDVTVILTGITSGASEPVLSGCCSLQN